MTEMENVLVGGSSFLKTSQLWSFRTRSSSSLNAYLNPCPSPLCKYTLRNKCLVAYDAWRLQPGCGWVLPADQPAWHSGAGRVRFTPIRVLQVHGCAPLVWSPQFTSVSLHLLIYTKRDVSYTVRAQRLRCPPWQPCSHCHSLRKAPKSLPLTQGPPDNQC